MAQRNRFNDDEWKILELLKDGERHRRVDVRARLDPLMDKGYFSVKLVKLNTTLALFGQRIISENIGRQQFLRHVILLKPARMSVCFSEQSPVVA